MANMQQVLATRWSSIYASNAALTIAIERAPRHGSKREWRDGQQDALLEQCLQ